jgi:aminoglycoside phosphotransferase (APT) family kinase protein
MLTVVDQRPDLPTLTAGLNTLLSGCTAATRPVTVIGREDNAYASSSRTEIVTCRLPDGSERRLLCKYEDKDGQSWSDVAYEAEVYRQVLQQCSTSVPAFYGTYRTGSTGNLWLIIEYLDGCDALAENLSDESMIQAASWAGAFHADGEKLLSSRSLPYLKRFDAEFYEYHLRRALQSCADGPSEFEWLQVVAQRFSEFVAPLWASRPTISHGDFAPYNLLLRDKSIYPIDWELAGIDLGELDLAFLMDGWSDDAQQQCKLAYQQARWPNGAPADFEETLVASRLCLYVYKLGGAPNWTADRESLWYCKQLRRVAERLGWVQG